MTHVNLNSYQRLQIYRECENNNTKFQKFTRKELKWICADHHKILITSEEAWCDDLCCKICPVNYCLQDNFAKVPVKVKCVTVIDNNK